MKVEKVINNNLIRSHNEKGVEVLVMGCGLGYKKEVGEEVDETKIEKVYTMQDHDAYSRLETLLARLPLDYIQVANEIINYAKISLQKKLNENVYLTLTDHISFAIERMNKGLIIRNALLWEIKHFYNHEYLIGKEALSIIKNRLGVTLPEDEAGFIAFHLVNASLDGANADRTEEMMKMMQDILSIVKYHFHMEFDEQSLDYERFITHLKFFIQRVFSGNTIEGENDKFFIMIKEQYKEEYMCALKVYEYFQNKYQLALSNEEMIYFTIHIQRVTAHSRLYKGSDHNRK